MSPSIVWPAVGATIFPNLGGWVGGLLLRENMYTWSESLRKPDWRPPKWAFGPVWTTLYSSIGYASYLVWRDGGGFYGPAARPLALYGINIALNWSWPAIFFGAHSLKWGLYEIVVLWTSTAITGVAFYNINRHAGYLFVPYLVWLSLATALNYVIYRDNPTPAIDGEKKNN